MKLKWLICVGIVFLATRVCAGDPPFLKTEKNKMSYSIGVNVIRNFRQQGIDFDPDDLGVVAQKSN